MPTPTITFQTFVYPDPGQLSTFSLSINDSGTVVGYYVDADFLTHGYIAVPPYGPTDFTLVDSPSAGNNGGNGDGTFPLCINNDGTVAGYWFNDFSTGGFVAISPYGNPQFTNFVPPLGEMQLGSNVSINNNGDYIGTAIDHSSNYQGFIGNGSTINAISGLPPGAINIFGTDINDSGVYTGSYQDGSSGPRYGFINNGSYTFFTVPSDATYPSGINNSNVISGQFVGDLSYQAFIRQSDGTLEIQSLPELESNLAASRVLNDLFVASTTSEVAVLTLIDGDITYFGVPGGITAVTQGAQALNNNYQCTGGYQLPDESIAGFVATFSFPAPPPPCFLVTFPILGPYYDLQGDVLANGKLLFKLVFDCNCPCADYQVTGNNEVSIELDENGMVIGTPQVRPNNQLAPSGSYYILRAYSQTGQLVLGPKTLVI